MGPPGLTLFRDRTWNVAWKRDTIRGICHVVSRFPLHFMLYRENLKFFFNSVQGPLMGTYPQSHHEASVVLGTRHFLASRQQHRGNITELQWREKIWTFYRPWCLNGVATTHMKTMQKSSKIWPEKDVHLVTVVLPRAPFWIFTKRLVSKNMCELIKKVVLQEQCHEIFNTKKKKKIKLGLMWTGRYDF